MLRRTQALATRKLVTCPRPAFGSASAAPIAIPTSRPRPLRREKLECGRRRNDDDGCRLALSATCSAPGGNSSPYRSTAAAPARAAAATVAAGVLPTGASTARPATRLKPLASKKSTPGGARSGDRMQRERVPRRDGSDEWQAPVEERRRGPCAGRRGPAARRCANPWRRRRAPLRHRPGPATEPNDGPAPPSLPAGATSNVPRSSAPCAALASGPSVNAAYGSTTPVTATRTASCASPSPFGSTARSSPASSWSLRA